MAQPSEPMGASAHALHAPPARRQANARGGAFVVQVLVVLAMGLLPWPGWNKAYCAFFSNVANFVAVHTEAPGSVHLDFAPIDEEEPTPWPVRVELRRAMSRAHGQFWIDVRALTYVPIVTFVALSLASAVWGMPKRRSLASSARRFAFGLLIVTLLAAFKVALPITHVIMRWGWWPVSPLTQSLTLTVVVAFNTLPGMTFAMPGGVWWIVESELVSRALAGIALTLRRRPPRPTALTRQP